MPTYDFRCTNCSYKFTKRVSYDEKNKVLCLECGQHAKQIFTGFMYAGKAGEGRSSSCTKSSCSSCSGTTC